MTLDLENKLIIIIGFVQHISQHGGKLNVLHKRPGAVKNKAV